jgi:hypothetical protein
MSAVNMVGFVPCPRMFTRPVSPRLDLDRHPVDPVAERGQDPVAARPLGDERAVGADLGARARDRPRGPGVGDRGTERDDLAGEDGRRRRAGDPEVASCRDDLDVERLRRVARCERHGRAPGCERDDRVAFDFDDRRRARRDRDLGIQVPTVDRRQRVVLEREPASRGQAPRDRGEQYDLLDRRLGDRDRRRAIAPFTSARTGARPRCTTNPPAVIVRPGRPVHVGRGDLRSGLVERARDEGPLLSRGERDPTRDDLDTRDARRGREQLGTRLQRRAAAGRHHRDRRDVPLLAVL